ncbi:rhodanese-like domain-containing protein [Actinocatenispora rupis]|uniref:Sulfurtransferase n=1 Tax=Actinocatenispora rupis TaxID=519421 RepID=A0A8J3IVS1_9ACTN|nr:rhodanese-like domain-containing protein [Actinocatenispora rupis]GID09495.1 sulfurtransferase [Actinocatenispora rupis]
MPQPPHVPSIDADAVAEDSIVLDVREPDEYAAGHIAAALHIPMGAVPDRLPELPDDVRLVVVCRSGGRSARVTAYLRQEGIDAVNLEGGMKSWIAAGRPMVTETGAAPALI